MTEIGRTSNRLGELPEAYGAATPFDVTKDAGRPARGTHQEEGREAALEKLEEAKDSLSRTTFRMWDRHTETVKKAQELNKAKLKKDALARRSRQARERQTELLAKMALENAARSRWLNAAARRRRDSEAVF